VERDETEVIIPKITELQSHSRRTEGVPKRAYVVNMSAYD